MSIVLQFFDINGCIFATEFLHNFKINSNFNYFNSSCLCNNTHNLDYLPLLIKEEYRVDMLK